MVLSRTLEVSRDVAQGLVQLQSFIYLGVLCHCPKDNTDTHKACDTKERTSQLDYIMDPRNCECVSCIHNDRDQFSTWGRDSVCATIREEEGQVQNISPNMWRMGKMHSLVNDEANADFTLKSCGLLCLRGPPV